MKKIIIIAVGVIIAVAAIILLSIGVGNEKHPDEETTLSEAEKPEVGGTLTFGSYEQNNDLRDGKEPIEWIVLADNGKQYTLISLKGLDAVAFALESAETTWETSYIRSWLNDSFYNTAFSEDERDSIAEMSLTNSPNPTFGTQGGNPTTDFVYLLSIDEYNSLMTGTDHAPCSPTEYAVAQGVKSNTTTGNVLCCWWLRTPGDEQIRAASFYNSNEAFYGSAVTTATNAVRPVITLNYAA